MVQLEPLRILLWYETASSDIKSRGTVILQIIVDQQNAKHFSYRFSSDELQQPNYNRLLMDLCRQLIANNGLLAGARTVV